MKFYTFLFLLFGPTLRAEDTDDEPLLEAAKNNDLETFQKLLVANENLTDTSDEYMNSLLQTAAEHGSGDVVKYLVTERRADINALDEEDYTALIRASKAGELETVQLLLDLGASTNRTTSSGRSALHAAVECDQVLNLLLNYFDVDTRDDSNETAAFLAARSGNAGTLQILLDNGADPYVRNVDNDTLMHAAASSGEQDVVEVLADYKDLLNATNTDSLVPIEEAFVLFNTPVIEKLVEAGAEIPDDFIWAALYYFQSDIFKYFVKTSGKVDLREGDGEKDNCEDTLMLYELNLKFPSYDLVEFLVTEGADVNLKNCQNETALHRAVYMVEDGEEALDTVKLLLDKGAEVDALDSDGDTPLDLADGVLKEYLLKTGAKSGKEIQP